MGLPSYSGVCLEDTCIVPRDLVSITYTDKLLFDLQN